MEAFFNQFLSFSLIGKLLIPVALYFFVKYIEVRYGISRSKTFYAMLFAIIIRDVAVHILNPVPEVNPYPLPTPHVYTFAIMYAVDTFILTMLYRWLSKHYENAKNVYVFVFINMAIALTIAVLSVSGVVTYDHPSRWLYNFTTMIALAAAFIKLRVLNNDFTIRSPIQSHIILYIRNYLLALPLVFIIVNTIFGYDHFIIRNLVTPLYSVLIFLLLFDIIGIRDKYETERSERTASDLSSLFTFVERMGKAISERLELSQVLEDIVTTATQNTRADAGTILLLDDYEGVLRPKVVEGTFPPPYEIPEIVKQKLKGMQNYFMETAIPIGQSVLGESALSGDPIFIPDTASSPLMKYNSKRDPAYIKSIIVIPLVAGGKVLGVLSVISRRPDRVFSMEDYEHIKTFADYASLTIDNLFRYLELLEKQEIEREVDIAAEIQNKLLPGRIPRMPGAQIAAYSRPAKGVSGDYWDVIPIKKHNKVAVVICDVAGKGVPASLIMVMIRTIIHLIAGSQGDPAKIVSWINRGIAGRIDIDRFATLGFVLFDLKTGELEFSNAAHHPLMIYRKESESIEYLDTEGLPIGLNRNSTYQSRKTKMNPGDILMLYTDGIIEAMDSKGQQYGQEAIVKILKENYNSSPDDLSEFILTDIENFVGNASQHDDMTMLILKAE